MEQITVLDKNFKIYIKNTEIKEIVNHLAMQLCHDLKDKNPLFVPILNGAFIFAGDLLKEINIPAEVSFMKVASYAGTETTGKTKTLIGLSEKIEGRTVIILEDIIDTGISMKNVLAELKKMNPKELKICTLFHKPEKFKEDFPIDYIGKNIPNAFIVGYGLDYNGYGRNLKEIYQVTE